MPSFSLMISAWVPLPAPGAPRQNQLHIRYPPSLLKEALVVAHQHLSLQLP